MRRPSALTVSSAVAVTAVVLTGAAPNQVWLRLPLGLLLVALLPGYGLMCAVFPGSRLGRYERAAIAIGLSIALTVFIGLLLDIVPAGLGTTSWILALAGATLVANVAARERRATPVRAAERLRLPRPSLVVTAVTAACFVVLMIVFSAGDTFAPASGEIIQLWALPSSTSASSGIEVGVSNQVSDARIFRLRIIHADSVLSERTLDLPEGTRRTFVVRLPAGASRQTPMRVVLTALGPKPSERVVSLWPAATVEPGGAGGR